MIPYGIEERCYSGTLMLIALPAGCGKNRNKEFVVVICKKHVLRYTQNKLHIEVFLIFATKCNVFTRDI